MGRDVILISSDDEEDIPRAAPVRVRKPGFPSAPRPRGRSGEALTARPSEVATPMSAPKPTDRGRRATLTPPMPVVALAETRPGPYPPQASLPASASTAAPGLVVMAKAEPPIPPEDSPPIKRESSIVPAVSPPVMPVLPEPAVPEDPGLVASNTKANGPLQAQPPVVDGPASAARDVTPPAVGGPATTTRAVTPSSIQAVPMDVDEQAAPEITAPDATRAASPSPPVPASCADQNDQAALVMSSQGSMDGASPTAIPSPTPNSPAPDTEAEAEADAETQDGQPAPAAPTQAAEFIPADSLDSCVLLVSAADTAMEDGNPASGTPPPPVDEPALATAPVGMPAASVQGSPVELPALAPAPILAVGTCDIQPAREATPTAAPAVTSALEAASSESPAPALAVPDPAASTPPASKTPSTTASVAPALPAAPVPAVPTPAVGSATSGPEARKSAKGRKAVTATTDPVAEAPLDAEPTGPATLSKDAAKATVPPSSGTPSPETPPKQGAKSSAHLIAPAAPTVTTKPPSSLPAPANGRPAAPRGENPVIAVDRLLRAFSTEVTETITGVASKAHFQLSLKKEIERFSASLEASRPQMILLPSPAAEEEELKMWQALARPRSAPFDDDEMDRDDTPTPTSAGSELTVPPSSGRKRKIASVDITNSPWPSPSTSSGVSKRLKAAATPTTPVSPQRDRPQNGYSLPRVCQIIDAVSTSGLPSQVSPDAVRTITLSALSGWSPKFSTFANTLFALVVETLRSVFTTHFQPYKYTLLFARTHSLLESLLSRSFSTTQTHLSLLLTLETQNVRTSLDPGSFRKLVDEKRSAVLSTRQRNLEVQYPRKPRMPSASPPAHDRYSRELEVIAEVLAYHDIARQRFVDYLGLFITGEFLEGVRRGLLGELRQKLGVEGMEAEEKCSALLEPIPSHRAAR